MYILLKLWHHCLLSLNRTEGWHLRPSRYWLLYLFAPSRPILVQSIVLKYLPLHKPWPTLHLPLHKPWPDPNWLNLKLHNNVFRNWNLLQSKLNYTLFFIEEYQRFCKKIDHSFWFRSSLWNPNGRPLGYLPRGAWSGFSPRLISK